MKRNEVLVAEISGKRPGSSDQRPTEKFPIDFDKVIISNNSTDYDTDWPIVNVPDDYREWYINNIKCSENAWYAPMNRSYAIKYAREHGYKYLIQLDDNIVLLEVATMSEHDGITKRYRANGNDKNCLGLMNDYIEMLCIALENTNAVMTGCGIAGLNIPSEDWLRERYCYSLFALKLSECPDVFQGDFEDDIEFRLKCKQMGLPAMQICPLRYGKVGQAKTKDLTGCRAEYARAGLMRGEHMCKLYGDLYTCKMSDKPHRTNFDDTDIEKGAYFKHTLKPFKVGIIVYDEKPLAEKMTEIFKKYSREYKMTNLIIRKKRKKLSAVKLEGE